MTILLILLPLLLIASFLWGHYVGYHAHRIVTLQLLSRRMTQLRQEPGESNSLSKWMELDAIKKELKK